MVRPALIALTRTDVALTFLAPRMLAFQLLGPQSMLKVDTQSDSRDLEVPNLGWSEL